MGMCARVRGQLCGVASTFTWLTGLELGLSGLLSKCLVLLRHLVCPLFFLKHVYMFDCTCVYMLGKVGVVCAVCAHGEVGVISSTIFLHVTF